MPDATEIVERKRGISHQRSAVAGTWVLLSQNAHGGSLDPGARLPHSTRMNAHPLQAGDVSYSDIERAAAALSVKLQPRVSAPDHTDTPLMRGTILAERVVPHLFATGYNLRYKTTLPLTQELNDVVQFSILIEGATRPLKMEGCAPATLDRSATLMLSAPRPSDCDGEIRAGDSSTVAGFSFRSAFLDSFPDLDEGVDVLRPLFAGEPTHRKLPLLRGLVRLGSELRTPRFAGGLRKLHTDSCVLEAVTDLVRLLLDVPGKPAEMTTRAFHRVRDAKEMIEADLAAPPSVEQICKALAINATSFRRQFRCVYGVSMFEYLRERRLDVARLLLQETDFPVADIAFRVGFTNSGAFAMAYRRRHGHPPSNERPRAGQ